MKLAKDVLEVVGSGAQSFIGMSQRVWQPENADSPALLGASDVWCTLLNTDARFQTVLTHFLPISKARLFLYCCTPGFMEFVNIPPCICFEA